MPREKFIDIPPQGGQLKIEENGDFVQVRQITGPSIDLLSTAPVLQADNEAGDEYHVQVGETYHWDRPGFSDLLLRAPSNCPVSGEEIVLLIYEKNENRSVLNPANVTVNLEANTTLQDIQNIGGFDVVNNDGRLETDKLPTGIVRPENSFLNVPTGDFATDTIYTVPAGVIAFANFVFYEADGGGEFVTEPIGITTQLDGSVVLSKDTGFFTGNLSGTIQFTHDLGVFLQPGTDLDVFFTNDAMATQPITFTYQAHIEEYQIN